MTSKIKLLLVVLLIGLLSILENISRNYQYVLLNDDICEMNIEGALLSMTIMYIYLKCLAGQSKGRYNCIC